MIVLSCNNLSKSYGVDVIFDSVTFSVASGEKIGLIGPNGAGKSTLLKIICKELEYDGGNIFIDKQCKIGYLSQHLSLDSDSTIYDEMLKSFEHIIKLEDKLLALENDMNKPYDSENKTYHEKIANEYTITQELYANEGGYTYKGEIGRVLKGLGFFPEDYDKSINILSGGQKTRVALCRLLLSKPNILLLDEPTNHLDLEAIEWLEEYLKAYSNAVIVISHDRYFLDAVTQKTYEMINGHINCYNGNYSHYIDERKKAYEVELKAYNIQQDEIKRQEEIIERYRSFNREKSIKAAESREKALNKIERLDRPDTPPKASKIKFETQFKSGNDVLHIENLSKSFSEKQLFKNVFIDMKKEEKTAIIGENGIGKTTLFKIIMNTDEDSKTGNKYSDYTGTKVLGKNVFTGYYDQEQAGLHDEKTVIDEIWDEYPDMTTTKVRNALAAFLFIGDDVFKNIGSLSGGEKCRVCLLKLMLSNANFLLLDEPTNHLDIVSREALEDAILSYDGTVLVISHDRYFLNRVAQKILELKSDGIKQYLGNYSYYIEKKKAQKTGIDIIETEGKTKTQLQLERKKKREEEKEKKEKQQQIKELENSIADKEGEIKSLEELLCLEEVYSNPDKAVDVNNKIKNAQNELEGLYENWENMLQ